MKTKKSKQNREELSPVLDETIPHQINSPNFKGSGISMSEPFVNKYGVIIGDSEYDSENSPLNHWSKETDPEMMSGDEWVHPTNDIGWNTEENRELIESKTRPKSTPFMHPMRDTSYDTD